MKYIKQKILLFVLLLAMAMPVSVYAAGEGNIDNGGGGMGAGTGTNFWSSHDEGVRVTVIRASDGSVASASIDLTNKHPTDIRVHFGKVSKTSYRNGAGLSARMGGYTFYNPAQSLPQIISTSRGGANLTAIKQYFTDEQVIRAIAGYVGMDFQTLTNGEYKLLLEPIAYVTFEGVRTAFTATEAAKYNQLRGGLLRKKMHTAMHIGIDRIVLVRNGIYHLTGFLCGRTVIKINQRLTIYFTRKYREISSYLLKVHIF